MSTRRDFLAFTAGAVGWQSVRVVTGHAEPVHQVADTAELLDRYDAWLDSERLALMREIHPTWDPFEARRFVPSCALVPHWWKGPAPSTRVLAVLGAAGVYTGPDTPQARRTARGG